MKLEEGKMKIDVNQGHDGGYLGAKQDMRSDGGYKK